MFGVWDSFYKVLLSRQKVEARKTIANMNFQQSIYVLAVSIVFKMKNDVLQFKIQFVATWKPENPGNVSNFLYLYTVHRPHLRKLGLFSQLRSRKAVSN